MIPRKPFFFLTLLIAQLEDSNRLAAGQAELLTGFVRRALGREVEERRHPLFDPDSLLSEDDLQQVIQREWISPYELPNEGLLIPKLAAPAFAMTCS